MGEKFSWDRLLKRGKENGAVEDNTIEIVPDPPKGLGPVAPLNASRPAPRAQNAPPQVTAPPIPDKDRAPLVIDWSEYQQLEATAEASAPAQAPIEVPQMQAPAAPPAPIHAPIEVPQMQAPVAPPAPTQPEPVAASSSPASEGFWDKLGSETNAAFGDSNAALRRAEAQNPKPQIAGWDDVDLTPSEKSIADPVTNSISVPEHTPRDPEVIEKAIQSIAQSSAWEEPVTALEAEIPAPPYTPIEFTAPVVAPVEPVVPPEPVYGEPDAQVAPPIFPDIPSEAVQSAPPVEFSPYVDPNAPTWGENAPSDSAVAPDPEDVAQAPQIVHEFIGVPPTVEPPVVAESTVEPTYHFEPVVEAVAPVAEEPTTEPPTAEVQAPIEIPTAEPFQWPTISEEALPPAETNVSSTWEESEMPVNESFETEVHSTVTNEFVCPPLPTVESEFKIDNPWEVADEAVDPMAAFVPIPVEEVEESVAEIVTPVDEPVAEVAPIEIETELPVAVEEVASELELPVAEEPPVTADDEAAELPVETVQSNTENFWDAILSTPTADAAEVETAEEDQVVHNATPVRSDLPEEYTHIPEERKHEEVARDSRIGELLVNHKLVSQGQIERAITRQQQTNEKLGQILISMGIMTERRLLQVLAAQKGVSPWHLEEDRPSQDAIRLIPQEMCRVFQMLPVAVRGDLLLLAMRDTGDAEAIEAVRLHTKKRVEPVMADEARLAYHIDRAFGVASSRGAVAVDEIVQTALETIAQQSEELEPLEADFNGPNTVPVNALVNQIVLDAIHAGASDVHLEPSHNKVEVRYRISGRLRTVRELPLELSELVVARLKYIGHLEVNQTTIPQSGRVSADFSNHAVDFKISVLPNAHGSRIVLRLLDRSLGLKTLDELGFEPENLKMFRDLINRPYGLFIIAGPTGNGKTTTLYSALSELQDSGLNIMTCEDPIEFDLNGINQTEVDRTQGLTYASQLQAILEQDPDVILVGEIRDRETAEIAVRAAISGKKVFATLDTNDAAGAVPRLIELGVDPAILATALTGIMSQRLMRTLGSDSRIEAEPSTEEKEFFQVAFGMTNIDKVWKAVGSEDSDGYSGRCAAHEILPITPDVARLIAEQATCEEIKELAGYYGYLPIQYDALNRILSGQTTLEEAQRNIAFDTFVKRVKPRQLDQAS